MRKIIFIITFWLTFNGLSVSAVIAETSCDLKFTLKYWAIIYQSGTGTGTITCDNGESAQVKIRTHGGGLTLGKARILDGHGDFTKVKSISELFGSYASAEAHGGIDASGKAQAMTKGEISMSLTGTGKGFDVGIAFGSFKISPIRVYGSK